MQFDLGGLNALELPLPQTLGRISDGKGWDVNHQAGTGGMEVGDLDPVPSRRRKMGLQFLDSQGFESGSELGDQKRRQDQTPEKKEKEKNPYPSKDHSLATAFPSRCSL